MEKRKFTFHFLAFCTAAVWGTTFISSKILIVDYGISPAMVFFLRFIIAYLGLWIICLLPKTHEKIFCKSIKEEIIFLILGITGGSIYFFAENTALEFTNASNVSFIVSTTPLMTFALTLAAKKLKIKGLSSGQENIQVNERVILGSILAILGVGAVIFNGAALHLSPKGDILAVVAALLWGIYSVFMGAIGNKYSSVFITRKVFFYGIITIIPFIINSGIPTLQTLTTPAVLYNLLFLGIVASLIAFLTWNKAITEIGSVSATNYIYFCPFFTLVLANAILDEKMTLISSLGSIAIVIGVFLAGKKSN